MCFVILLHEPIPLSIVKSPVLNCYDSLVPGLVESAEVQRSDSRWPSGSIGPGYPRWFGSTLLSKCHSHCVYDWAWLNGHFSKGIYPHNSYGQTYGILTYLDFRILFYSHWMSLLLLVPTLFFPMSWESTGQEWMSTTKQHQTANLDGSAMGAAWCINTTGSYQPAAWPVEATWLESFGSTACAALGTWRLGREHILGTSKNCSYYP